MTVPLKVYVVVPAHDEEALLGACLASVAAAAGEVPHHDVRILVVLDACTDATATVAARAGVETLGCEVRNVGAARRLGVDRATATTVETDRVWIACTDADTRVPRHWVATQVGLAAAGAQLVTGTVRPDPADLDEVALRAWQDRHPPGSTRVHGANLGFALSAYLQVGGFEPVASGEDVRLVQAMRRGGVPEVFTAMHEVVTSGRRRGRAPDGFAAYVERLGGPDDDEAA